VLAEHIIGRPVPERDLESLYAETEGSPLFVVETLRAGWLGGSTAQPSISPKVQAAITARLAQLSEPARNLVGFAATIGRAFPTDVLAEAAEVDADALVRALDELWRRRIIREQGAGAYDFSHDKIREGAYLGLSPARRSQAHLRVARALESRHAHNLGQVSGELAAHYERAGLTDQAITWYGRAAETALELNTNYEAVRLLDRALELLRTLPETPERQTKQLALLESLPTPLGVVEGWSSERTAAAHERALSLSRAIGVEPSSPLLRSLAIASLTRRDFATARDYGERLRVRGEHNANNMLLVEADYVLGIAAFWQGEFVSAQTHFESAVTRYVPEHRRAHLLHYGLDPKVICLSRLGNTLWILGYPESATRARDEALAFAGEINHPYSLGVALVFAIFLSLEMREIDAMRAYLETLTALRGASDTKTIENAIQLFDGYLSVLDGRSQEGIAGIQQALAEVEAADRAPGQRALIMRLLVEACAIAGDVRAGLAAADAALASSDAGRLFEAEIRRHRAEFLGALGAPDAEVERELERALAVARRQSALMYELRSAISLLRHHRGRNDDRGTRTAYQCLEAIVARLPKDQESRERQEAVSLLSQN
jgi:tetratricopeptide (TPR) repeat protein